MELGGELLECLKREAARQRVAVKRILEHAVVLYLAGDAATDPCSAPHGDRGGAQVTEGQLQGGPAAVVQSVNRPL